MYVNELPLFCNPRCSVSLQEYPDQPTDDYDRRYNTLLLTLRVRLSRPSSSSSYAAAPEIRLYTRMFSEPLTVFTHPRHVWTARNKVGRMLDVLWVPRRRIDPDLVDKIIAGVRRTAYDFEDPPPVLRVDVNVDAVVLRLPPVSESEWNDDGAPTYIDGADSRDYERYKAEDDAIDLLLYNDDFDVIEYDDDDEFAGWPERGEQRLICRRLLDDELAPGDEYYPNGASSRNQMVAISLNVTFRLPPPFTGVEKLMCRNFCETLEVIADERQEATAMHRISVMLRRVRVPHRFWADAAESILREVRSTAQRRWCDFDVMWIVLTLDVFTYDQPDLSSTLRFVHGSLNYYDANSGAYVASRPTPETGDADLVLDDGTEPRFVPACSEAIESLEKVIVSGDDMTMDCRVCLEDISVGSEVTRLPCSHCFHGVCIVKWLEQSLYCPLCRFQLPSL